MIYIIENNPFRVLGAWSNSKQADIVRNVSKMKAYLNVGRSVDFPTDLPGILPALNRTLQSAQAAQAAINLPNDKIRYALFWFCNADPVDSTGLNNLVSGDSEKAMGIFTKRESFSSLVNQAVLSLIQSNYSAAVNAYSKLLHDFTYRGQFCAAICGETFKISEEDLSHLLFEELLKGIKASNLLQLVSNDVDRAFVKEKAVEEPVSLINSEIAKAKSVQATDAAESLRAGRLLIQNTKNALESLKAIVGTEDIQYQSAADSLAKQILQSGINYFNNTEDSDAINNALKLQEYALSLACGKLMKDRCEKNVDILRKRKQQAVYEEDIKAIADALGTAREGVGSISKSRQLLDKCESHLAVLKSKMGANDSNYLQISSAVVNTALSLVIAEVNRNTDSKSTAKSAQEVITRIAGMDMDSQTRSRVSQNAVIIASNIAKIPSGFDKVNNELGGCLGYIIGFGALMLFGWLCSLCS